MSRSIICRSIGRRKRGNICIVSFASSMCSSIFHFCPRFSQLFHVCPFFFLWTYPFFFFEHMLFHQLLQGFTKRLPNIKHFQPTRHRTTYTSRPTLQSLLVDKTLELANRAIQAWSFARDSVPMTRPSSPTCTAPPPAMGRFCLQKPKHALSSRAPTTYLNKTDLRLAPLLPLKIVEKIHSNELGWKFQSKQMY